MMWVKHNFFLSSLYMAYVVSKVQGVVSFKILFLLEGWLFYYTVQGIRQSTTLRCDLKLRWNLKLLQKSTSKIPVWLTVWFQVHLNRTMPRILQSLPPLTTSYSTSARFPTRCFRISRVSQHSLDLSSLSLHRKKHIKWHHELSISHSFQIAFWLAFQINSQKLAASPPFLLAADRILEKPPFYVNLHKKQTKFKDLLEAKVAVMDTGTSIFIRILDWGFSQVCKPNSPCHRLRANCGVASKVQRNLQPFLSHSMWTHFYKLLWCLKG